MNKTNKYEITLKDGSTMVLWFIGDKLERLMDEYNIPYKKLDDNFNWGDK